MDRYIQNGQHDDDGDDGGGSGGGGGSGLQKWTIFIEAAFDQSTFTLRDGFKDQCLTIQEHCHVIWCHF